MEGSSCRYVELLYSRYVLMNSWRPEMVFKSFCRVPKNDLNKTLDF
jgi:hypothetical protein